ncbi:MAG TPA: TonB-dependent receptor [Gemmatimonadaceae bacterium]|nr:TonB-dependent receptor [Gemmatimonadaceae bacterium]
MPSARSTPWANPDLGRAALAVAADARPRASWRALATSAAAVAVLLAGVAPAPVGAQQEQRLAPARAAAYVVAFTPGAEVDPVSVPVALRQPLTLDLRRVTVERALQEVMNRAGIALTYSRAVVPLERIVSVRVEDGSVIEALQQVLGGTDVELWVSAEGRMALVPGQPQQRAPRRRVAQTGIVTGRVTSAEGNEPLVGVTVRVGDSQAGAVTNSEGRYTIPAVPAGPHLIRAQRIGFAPDSQTVTVPDGGTVTADFTLRVRAVQLSEVVAIGYGTTSRREVTGAISSVGSDEIRTSPSISVDQALQGRAPGVQVVSASGQPGATAMVRIRGGNSITAGNDPLYVIDGVPIQASPNGANTSTLEVQGSSGISPLAAINPNDIESIDVLKDASAAAIYGARAANGVILITTKRGRTSGQPQINFGTYYGTQTVRHKLSLLDAKQFAQMANEARVNGGQEPIYTDAEIASFGAGTNWQDAIFRTAPTQNFDLSINGGANDTRYFLSGNLLKQDGVVLGTDLTRGSIRLNLDQAIGKRLRFGNRLTFTREQGNVMPNGGGGEDVSSVLLNALTAPPTLPIKGSGGEYFIGLNPATGRAFPNPVASALLITNLERQNRFVGNVFGEYDLVPGLTVRSSFGGDYLTSMQDFYSPSTTYPGITYSGAGSRGSLQTTTWLNENTIDYRRSSLLGLLTDVDLLAGLTLQRTSGENVSGSSQGFVTDALAQNGLITGTSYLGVWTGAPHSSLLSYLSRARWSITDRYLFSVAGRWDGSSKFGVGNRYGFFPSASFAWRLGSEPFMKRFSFFDDLKLRTSFGRTGNQDIGNYLSLATLGPSSYVFNGVRVTGYSPTTLPNPNLKWETTNEADVGLDAAVFRNRIAVTADYYNKHTKDLLYEVNVPATLGVSTQVQNIGGVGNKGFELGINTVNLTGRLGWTSSLNLAWNRNRVLNIGVDTQVVGPVGVGAGAVQNPTVLKVGQPINSFYGYVYSGIADGQVQYKDLNGDTAITTADQTIIGRAQPNYTGGFTNRLTFGNFGLTAFIQFSVGGQIYNINRAILTSTSGRRNQLTDVLAAMNGGANGISEPKVGNTFDSRPSTLFVEDGTYIRGKNLRLDYTIPGAWLVGARLRNVSSVQIYASLQNFFTSTKYTGFDPEVTEYATSAIAQGIDFGTYPQTRQFTIGLNAGF